MSGNLARLFNPQTWPVLRQLLAGTAEFGTLPLLARALMFSVNQECFAARTREAMIWAGIGVDGLAAFVATLRHAEHRRGGQDADAHPCRPKDSHGAQGTAGRQQSDAWVGPFFYGSFAGQVEIGMHLEFARDVGARPANTCRSRP